MRQDFKTKILQLRCNAKFVFVGKITTDVKSKFQNEIHCFTSEVNDINFDILHIQKNIWIRKMFVNFTINYNLILKYAYRWIIFNSLLIFTNIEIFHGHQTSNVTRPQRHRIQIKYYYTRSNNKCYQAVNVALPTIQQYKIQVLPVWQ